MLDEDDATGTSEARRMGRPRNARGRSRAAARNDISARAERRSIERGRARKEVWGERAKGASFLRFFAPIKISGSGWRLRETLSPLFFSEGVLRNDYCTLKNLAKRITSSAGSSAPPCCPWPSRPSNPSRRRRRPPPSRVARERPPRRRRRREERKARSPRRRG